MVVVFMAIVAIVLILGGVPMFAMLQTMQGNMEGVWIKALMSSMVATLIFLMIVIGGRFISYEIVRWIYMYLGVLSFGFFISCAYRLCSFVSGWLGWGDIMQMSVVKIGFLLVWVVIVGISIYNFFKPISIKEITIKTDKVTERVQFVHIADTQYGTVTKKHMNKVLHLAEGLNPAFIVFVGDLIDFDDYKQEDFSELDELSMPVYFVTGNHEYYHKPETISDYLRDMDNITVLEDQQVMATPEVAVVGLDYHHHLDKSVTNAIQGVQINPSIYTVLINHVPEFVEEAAERGFDMQLYGHTHGGQIWPWNYLVKMLFPYGDGSVHTINTTTVYTTHGAGLRGPRMRLGTQNEIVLITLEPKG